MTGRGCLSNWVGIAPGGLHFGEAFDPARGFPRPWLLTVGSIAPFLSREERKSGRHHLAGRHPDPRSPPSTIRDRERRNQWWASIELPPGEFLSKAAVERGFNMKVSVYRCVVVTSVFATAVVLVPQMRPLRAQIGNADREHILQRSEHVVYTETNDIA